MPVTTREPSGTTTREPIAGAQLHQVEESAVRTRWIGGSTSSMEQLGTTDDAGAFSAVNLIPGSYTVNASRTGFRPVVFRNFVLQVGQSARLDIGSARRAVA